MINMNNVKCIKCGGTMEYYDGMLGYESLQCGSCHWDINDGIKCNEIDCDIPNDIKMSLNMYVYYGIMPGGFLTAVLENNLCEAFFRADSRNIKIIENIVKHIYHNIPSMCWGSKEKIKEWLEYLRGNNKNASNI